MSFRPRRTTRRNRLILGFLRPSTRPDAGDLIEGLGPYPATELESQQTKEPLRLARSRGVRLDNPMAPLPPEGWHWPRRGS